MISLGKSENLGINKDIKQCCPNVPVSHPASEDVSEHQARRRDGDRSSFKKSISTRSCLCRYHKNRHVFFVFFFSFSAAVCISNIRHLSAHSSGRVTLNLTQAVEHSVVEELSFKKVF